MMAIPNQRQEDILYGQPQQQPQQPQQPINKPNSPARKKSRSWTKGEKIISMAMVGIFAVVAIMNLNVQSSISETNVDIHKLDAKIAQTQKKNEELRNVVAEKSTYERFVKKAKELGLTPNADNIKAVSK